MGKATNYRPTTLGFAILGLLQDEPRSGYAVRKVFETTALGQYSSSPGSIYPAIRRLVEAGLVRPKDKRARGAHLKITTKGLKTLRAWLNTPVDPTEVHLNIQELLLRFVFMDRLVDRPTTVSFLESLRDGAVSQADQLQRFLKERGGEMPLHARLALRHGIGGYRADGRWARWALKELSAI